MKTNCWDYLHCGRELSGKKVNKKGVCPAVTYTAFNQTNGGHNGGRYCWQIVGTFPDRDIDCQHAKKINDCTLCSFFKMVQKEEGAHFVI